LLEKLVEVPRDHALSLYVRHPFIDRVSKGSKLLGLGTTDNRPQTPANR